MKKTSLTSSSVLSPISKPALTAIVAILIVFIGAIIYINYIYSRDGGQINSNGQINPGTAQGLDQGQGANNVSSTNPKTGTDYKNTTYTIDGKKVTLKNGVAESESVSAKIITRYFGNEVKGDFNGDGREDVAFILTQEKNDKSILYYVVTALSAGKLYIGSDGFLLGDRIAPQTTVLGKNNSIVINYAIRKSGESFDISPSIGKSVRLLLDTKTMQFGEVVQNFEGKADPVRMTLGMNKWNWISTTYNDGTVIKPRIENKFTLSFKVPNTFSATTDCNGVGGEYAVSGNNISFDKMMSTLMFCEGSQENDFSKSLSEVKSYHFTSKGELIFDLKFDSGVMVFK